MVVVTARYKTQRFYNRAEFQLENVEVN